MENLENSYLDENNKADFVKILKNDNAFENYINDIKSEVESQKDFKKADFEELFCEALNEDLDSHLIFNYQFEELIAYFGVDVVQEKMEETDSKKIMSAVFNLTQDAIYEKLDEIEFFETIKNNHSEKSSNSKIESELANLKASKDLGLIKNVNQKIKAVIKDVKNLDKNTKTKVVGKIIDNAKKEKKTSKNEDLLEVI